MGRRPDFHKYMVFVAARQDCVFSTIQAQKDNERNMIHSFGALQNRLWQESQMDFFGVNCGQLDFWRVRQNI
jgi:hypothetical protein